MGNDGEAKVNLVSRPVKIDEPTQNSINWLIVRGICEYRQSVQCR
jgi:hypothetical protein